MTTQKAFASYQEIIDLHTESDKVSVIGLHTPQGDTPRKMFGGFFDQFKKFKYYGCSISLVPAARLPADPSQVSYEGGEAIIDPRDLMNPLMFHGCHGNDMGVILNRLYALNSLDARKTDSMFMFEEDADLSGDTVISEMDGFQLEDLYYKALTDNTWKKAHPQRGFRKNGLRPLVYTMATNMQFMAQGGLNPSLGIPTPGEFDIGGTAGAETVIGSWGKSSANRQFFTPRLTGLGWLDTRNVLTSSTYADEVALTNDFQNVYDMIDEANKAQISEASLPLVYMGMILMPPAYKTEQYFRMIITHHFGFKEFRGISFSNVQTEPVSYSQFNDPEEDYYQGDESPSPEPEPEPTPTPTVYDFTLDGVPYSTRLYTDASLTSYVDVYNYNIASSGDVAYPLPSENLKYAYQARLSNGNILNLNSDNVQINALVTPLTATGNNRVGAMLADGSIVFNGLVYARQTGSDGLTSAYFPTKGDASTVPIVFTNWDTAPFYGSGIGSTSVYSIEVLE